MVGGDRADITPVAVETVLEHAAIGDQVGHKRVAVVAGRLLVGESAEAIEELGDVEREHLRAHSVPGRFVGFVLETGDRAVGDGDPCEPGRVVVGGRIGRHDRHRRCATFVSVEDVTEVEPVKVIGAHRHHHIGRERSDQVAMSHERVGVAVGHPVVGFPALERRQNLQAAVGAVEVPRPAVGEMVVEGMRFVLLDHPHVVEPAVGHIRQGDVDEAVHAGERHGRFGPALGQRTEAAAGATGEHDDEHTRTARRVAWAGG